MQSNKNHSLKLLNGTDFYIQKFYRRYYTPIYNQDKKKFVESIVDCFSKKLPKYKTSVVLDESELNNTCDVIITIERLLFKKEIRFYMKQYPSGSMHKSKGHCSINEVDIQYDNECNIDYESGLRYFFTERDLWRYIDYFFGAREIAKAKFNHWKCES